MNFFCINTYDRSRSKDKKKEKEKKGTLFLHKSTPVLFQFILP